MMRLFTDLTMQRSDYSSDTSVVGNFTFIGQVYLIIQFYNQSINQYARPYTPNYRPEHDAYDTVSTPLRRTMDIYLITTNNFNQTVLFSVIGFSR
jgi:hypothetical protein